MGLRDLAVGLPWPRRSRLRSNSGCVKNDNISGAEILRRVQLAGYRGRKSALYELVKRLRTNRAELSSKESSSSS